MATDSAMEPDSVSNSISGDGQAVRASALSRAPEASSGQTNGVSGHVDGSARPPVSVGAVVTDDGNWSTGRGSPATTGPRAGGQNPRRGFIPDPDRVYGAGGYSITRVQYAALRCLSWRMVQTVEELTDFAVSDLTDRLSLGPDLAAVARAAGMKPVRLRALFSTHKVDPEIETSIGSVRRPRRSTLLALATALGLPQPAVVVGLWCKHAPDAVAPECAS